MLFRVLANAVVLGHAAFIAFVVLGGLIALRWPWVAWLHVPAAVWGSLIEFAGWVCPLTPLENFFRARAGEAGYAGGFMEHYVLHLIYPNGLTRPVQWTLGGAALLVNVTVYTVYVIGWRRRGHTAT